MNVSVDGHTVAAAWDHGYKLAVKDPPAHKARVLLEAIGPRITAASLGLADARQVKRWAAYDGLPREEAVERRLDALYQMVVAVCEVYPAEVAARWLRSQNPELDDEAPLVLLAQAESGEDVRRVLSAARSFLER